MYIYIYTHIHVHTHTHTQTPGISLTPLFVMLMPCHLSFIYICNFPCKLEGQICVWFIIGFPYTHHD